jgi:hypothetical protein
MFINNNLPSGTVTFLFTDIQGSTPLWEQAPAAMQVAIAQHHHILRQAIESNGGTVYQIIGDAFQAAFRLASQALNAALDAQRALKAASWPESTGPLSVRMGIHTGSAEIDPNDDAPYAVSHTLKPRRPYHVSGSRRANPAFSRNCISCKPRTARPGAF